MKCLGCKKDFVQADWQIKRAKTRKYGGKFCTTSCYRLAMRMGVIKNAGQFKHGQQIAEKNPRWAGDKIGYWGVHDWIYKELGQLLECENCFVNNDPGRKYQWANLSGKYRRDISDWARLCHLCHTLIDDRTKNMRTANQKPVRTITPRNKSGYKNVFQDKRTGKYIPYIRIAKRKQKWLGRFDTAKEAYEVYKAAALEMYGVY